MVSINTVTCKIQIWVCLTGDCYFSPWGSSPLKHHVGNVFHWTSKSKWNSIFQLDSAGFLNPKDQPRCWLDHLLLYLPNASMDVDYRDTLIYIYIWFPYIIWHMYIYIYSFFVRTCIYIIYISNLYIHMFDIWSIHIIPTPFILVIKSPNCFPRFTRWRWPSKRFTPKVPPTEALQGWWPPAWFPNRDACEAEGDSTANFCLVGDFIWILLYQW